MFIAFWTHTQHTKESTAKYYECSNFQADEKKTGIKFAHQISHTQHTFKTTTQADQSG
jgi:hypothetical protein